MTLSKKAQLLRGQKTSRDRTLVKVQTRNMQGRSIYSISIPIWVIKKMNIQKGASFLVLIEPEEHKIIFQNIEAFQEAILDKRSLHEKRTAKENTSGIR